MSNSARERGKVLIINKVENQKNLRKNLEKNEYSHHIYMPNAKILITEVFFLAIFIDLVLFFLMN